MEPLPSRYSSVSMTFPLLVQPNWKQERRIFRNRLIQYILLIFLDLIGVYTLPNWALLVLICYGFFILPLNAWAIRTSWQPLPTINLFGDQLLTIFLLSLTGAGGSPFIFMIYMHVLIAIIFTGQRNIIITFTLLQLFNLSLATLLSGFTETPGHWKDVLFQALGLFVINLFGIRPAEDLHQEAQTDPLTGSLNRRSGFGKLEQWLNAEQPFSLLVIDMKRFKDINDSYGHTVGDEVLQVVSQRLHHSVRENDLVIRQGGDEFLIATNGFIAPIIERLEKALEQRVQTSVGALEVAIDIGAAQYPGDAKDLETLLAIADEKMYAAKAGIK
jgi:diguanylate cyclase (GGDEF)-like protein